MDRDNTGRHNSTAQSDRIIIFFPLECERALTKQLLARTAPAPFETCDWFQFPNRSAGVSHIGATPAGARIQKAWLDREVVQCGYCQSGQIMSASALLANNPHPTDADIDDAMSGNICRCGTYVRIREAIRQAAESNG
jgi:[2Fe-2S] binding domain